MTFDHFFIHYTKKNIAYMDLTFFTLRTELKTGPKLSSVSDAPPPSKVTKEKFVGPKNDGLVMAPLQER